MSEQNDKPSLLPLVLVPGSLCDQRLFAPQINHFSKQRPVYVADVTQSNSISYLASDVLGTIKGAFALAGLSMGGIIAMEVMRQAPERVDRLALLNTSFGSEPSEKQNIRQQQMDLVNRDGMTGLISLVEDYYFPKYLAKNCAYAADIKRTVIDMANDAGIEVFNKQWEALLHRIDSTESLQRVDVPTLILCGEEDVLCKPKIHQKMAELIQESHLEILPDCGHLSTLEKPDMVNRSLQFWLQRIK
ncbi:MAG: alpha/beta fold hydrolase [Gammaproteobacteria bacterium]|nr:alpha/beta hydrolase [Gammaproteobacteria bacterium]NNC97272.1 alpha/beta fold hydrolase [Gammaproteobacteria bacterium]NNM14691.1 alpha/beta fold hydrolase [Gammaproteobacteria bacterium]